MKTPLIIFTLIFTIHPFEPILSKLSKITSNPISPTSLTTNINHHLRLINNTLPKGNVLPPDSISIHTKKPPNKTTPKTTPPPTMTSSKYLFTSIILNSPHTIPLLLNRKISKIIAPNIMNSHIVIHLQSTPKQTIVHQKNIKKRTNNTHFNQSLLQNRHKNALFNSLSNKKET
jgi:hypothetical protein